MKSRKEIPGYTSWHGMIERCRNKNRADYRRYGGRGITVCERWMDFNNFIEDMGQRPDGATLDRIDNDWGYAPENCRWASRKVQSLNSTSSVVVDGKSLSDHAKGLNISLSALSVAFKRSGVKCLDARFWELKNQKTFSVDGQEKTLDELARAVGVSKPAMSKRIKKWGVDTSVTVRKYETRRGNTNAAR